MLQTTTLDKTFFKLIAVFSLLLTVNGENNATNLGLQNSYFDELLGYQRGKRAADSKELGECEFEEFVYCPYKYTLQMTPEVTTTKAELALCKRECPSTKDLNTAGSFQGCIHDFGCATEHVEPCKALGASCLNKNSKQGSTAVFDCCSGRIITPAGVKIPVAGVCNLKTFKCEPRFPLNTVCGYGMKEYLSCYDDPDTYHRSGELARCSYPTEPIKEPTDKMSRVVRATKYNTTNGMQVEEPGRCSQSTNTCNPKQPLKIFCGPKLPKEYDNFPFCGCPSPDGETGYHCNFLQRCGPCKLAGVNCRTSGDCCIKHICSQGTCVRK